MAGAEHSLTHQAVVLVTLQSGLKVASATPLKIVLVGECQQCFSNHTVLVSTQGN